MLAQTEIYLLLAAGHVFYNNPLRTFDDFSDWALSITLIAIGVIFIVAFLYLGLAVIRRLYRHYKARKSPEEMREEDRARAYEMARIREIVKREKAHIGDGPPIGSGIM